MVINKCLLSSWKGSKKKNLLWFHKKHSQVKIQVQRKMIRKKTKKAHPRKQQMRKKDKESSNEDKGEFEFDDDTACIEYIKVSYHAKADRESTWELPHNTGRKNITNCVS